MGLHLPTPKATRCPANPSSNLGGSWAADKAFKADKKGRGCFPCSRFLQDFLGDLSQALWNSCVGPGYFSTLWPIGHLLASNSPRRLYLSTHSPTSIPPIPDNVQGWQPEAPSRGWPLHLHRHTYVGFSTSGRAWFGVSLPANISGLRAVPGGACSCVPCPLLIEPLPGMLVPPPLRASMWLVKGLSVQSDSWPLLAGDTFSCSYLIPR